MSQSVIIGNPNHYHFLLGCGKSLKMRVLQIHPPLVALFSSEFTFGGGGYPISTCVVPMR
jgi:hypothetical protein